MFTTITSTLAKVLIAPLIFFMGLAGYNIQNQTPLPDTIVLGADTVLPVAGTTYTLSGGGVSSSATSIILSSLTLPQTGQELVDSDFSSTFYVTLEPGNRSRQEIVSCTTVTQNSGTTATLSGCTRGLSPFTPFTASSTLQFSHGGGSSVIFSDPPQLFNEFTAKGNDESITGDWIYSGNPTLTTDCTGGSTNDEICAKAYIDGVAVAGASNANETTKGIVEQANRREAASSTATGSTGAALFLPASISTTTRGTLATSSVVMTRVDQTISPILISTSTDASFPGGYVWGSQHTFNASTTFQSATTTFNATTTFGGKTGAPVVINSIPYTFPSALTASGTVLTTNGSGSLSFNTPRAARFLGATTTDEIVANTTTETTFGTGDLATLTGGMMSTNGVVKVTLYGTDIDDNDSSESATIRVKLGGTEVCTVATPTVDNVTGNSWSASFEIMNTGSASIQNCFATIVINNSTGLTDEKIGSISETTSTINTGIDQLVTITWAWAAGSNCTVTMSAASVLFLGSQ